MKKDHSDSYWIGRIFCYSRIPFPLLILAVASLICYTGYWLAYRCNVLKNEEMLKIIVILIFLYLVVLWNGIILLTDYLKKMFLKLRSVVDLEDEEYTNMVNETKNYVFGVPKLIYFLFFLLTVVEVIVLRNSEMYHPIFMVDVLIFLVLTVVNLTLAVGVWGLYSLMQFIFKFGTDIPLSINPFHPDRMGGIGSIADLLLLILLVIASIGCLAVILWYMFNVLLSFLFAISISLVLPALFFYNVGTLHNLLVQKKYEVLDEIVENMTHISKRILNQRFYEESSDRATEEISFYTRSLASLRDMYTHINGMREWPTAPKIVLKIGTAIGLPLVTFLIGYALEGGILP
ncbi:MAG: hypothetical protein HXS46_08215 [Theionarchaea archaeon]|nr:MAG: hypothetical protein AYK18_15400 [Theionarchaea archaeon DG-70]MBU7010661.1 hypothetical protein [Theionarchaea archaeon]